MRDPREIAALLYELADRVAFAGESPFKVRAYREAARRLEMHAVDPGSLDALEAAPGIGKKIAQKIVLMAQGELPPGLMRRREDQPPELSALLRLPGVGPSTARHLWAQGIGTVAGLRDRLEAGEQVGGVSQGQRRQLLRAFAERRLGVPLPDLMRVTEALRGDAPGIAPTGQLRRLDPTVLHPRWLVTRSEAEAARRGLPLVLEGIWTIGPDAVLAADEDAFGPVLLWHTGPESFLREVGDALARQGLRLAADGLYRDERQVPCRTEAELFEAAGLAWVAPPLRGLDPAARKEAPTRVLGDLHTHSTWSDGLEDIARMAEAAIERGYSYLAVSDHSQGLKVANGLTPERFREQRREIERLRRTLPEDFALLQGCEVDIRGDGSLDLPDDLLEELDIVIASVHNHFDQDVASATERLVRAIRHPLVTAIGHPGARKLGERPPIAADWEKVFAAARDTGTALELSASPRRLDLDYRWLDRQGPQGLLFVIDTDAHSVHELDYMPLGIAQAQKAGVKSGQVLNAGPVAAWKRPLVAR